MTSRLSNVKTRLLDYLLKPPQTGAIGPLELLVLQPTPFCNLDCDYCYLPDRRATHRMNPEVIEKTFREVFRSGLVDKSFKAVWHAGEPMVVGIPFYEEALKIIDGLKPPGVEVIHTFQTNATLITDEWCEFIKRHRFQIGVSVDGPAEIHDRHRKTRTGAGTHQKVMRGIRLLQKHRISFGTISVLTADALDHPREMFDFFSENGLQTVGFNVEEREGNHRASTLDASGVHERLNRFMSDFYDLNEGHGRKIRIREFSRFESSIVNWTTLGSKINEFTGTQENSPFKIISVGWDGHFSTFSPELLGLDVAPYGKFTFGNMLFGTLAEAIEKPKFRDAAVEVQRGIRKCKESCSYFSVCGGGSPANKYFENGSFDSSETMHCRLHVQALAEVVLAKIENKIRVKAM